MPYSETDNHTHEPEGLCVSCLRNDLITKFQENHIHPFEAIGILETIKADLLQLSLAMVNGSDEADDEE